MTILRSQINLLCFALLVVGKDLFQMEYRDQPSIAASKRHRLARFESGARLCRRRESYLDRPDKPVGETSAITNRHVVRLAHEPCKRRERAIGDQFEVRFLACVEAE